MTSPLTAVLVDSMYDTDYGKAKALEAIGFGKRFRWSESRNTWMWWTGHVWRETSRYAAPSEASEMLRQYYETLLQCATDNKTIRDIRRKIKSGVYLRVRGALCFLRGNKSIAPMPEEWDLDPWLLNANNGILDLRTRDLRPHDPDAMMTKLAKVDYDPAATGPKWQQHLETVQPDPEIRRQLQRDLGLALVGHKPEFLTVWYGPGGNGMTTTALVLRNVLGDYAKTSRIEPLVNYDSYRNFSELANLRGSRLIFASKSTYGFSLSEGRIMRLTECEEIKARGVARPKFEFQRTWSVVFITNHRPQIQSMHSSIRYKVHVIPWNANLCNEHERPMEEVVSELSSESSAIFNWLLDGLADWQRDPNWVAPAVRAFTSPHR